MVRTRTSVLEDALEGDAELSLSAVLDYMGCDDWLVEIFMVSISSSGSSRIEIMISQLHPSLLFYHSTPLLSFLHLIENDFNIFCIYPVLYLSSPVLFCPALYLSSVLRSISSFY